MKRFALITFVLLFGANITFAQIESPVQEINLVFSNENPMPQQEITIRAESYVADLNASDIVWKLNGTVYMKGMGVTNITLKAPDAGKKTKIDITAVTPDGRNLSYSTTLGSGSVDIIVEHDGYIPPFFSGKIPMSFENTYRLVAIPHLVNSSGKEYDMKTLIYEWNKDSKVMQSQNGYGKQVFSLKDDIIPRTRLITVNVSSKDGLASAERSIFLQAKNPFILFHKNDPLYGPLYNNALNSNVGLGKSREVSVLATPYGFNKPKDGVGDLSFVWLVNSVKQSALNFSQSIVLRAPADVGGSSNIDLNITNSENITQSARGGFQAIFSSPENNNTSDFSGGGI